MLPVLVYAVTLFLLQNIQLIKYRYRQIIDKYFYGLQFFYNEHLNSLTNHYQVVIIGIVFNGSLPIFAVEK